MNVYLYSKKYEVEKKSWYINLSPLGDSASLASLPCTPRLPLALRLSSASLPPLPPYSSTPRVSFRFDLPQYRHAAAHPSRCRPHRNAAAPSLPSPHLLDISGSTPMSPTLCSTCQLTFAQPYPCRRHPWISSPITNPRGKDATGTDRSHDPINSRSTAAYGLPTPSPEP
jgi:hypothetical protein